MRAFISLLCIAAMATAFAFSDRIAGLFPQATWFVIVFVGAVLVIVLWMGRNDPAIGRLYGIIGGAYRRWSRERHPGGT